MSEKKYKVALVRVYSTYNYNDDYVQQVKDNFQWIEVTEKQYKALQDYRVREQILKKKYGEDYDLYSDKLLMFEDRILDLQAIINDSEAIVKKIELQIAKEEAERQAKLKRQAEKRKKTKELKAKAAKEKELERARKLLQESGEL